MGLDYALSCLHGLGFPIGWVAVTEEGERTLCQKHSPPSKFSPKHSVPILTLSQSSAIPFGFILFLSFAVACNAADIDNFSFVIPLFRSPVSGRRREHYVSGRIIRSSISIGVVIGRSK
ncbi:hypothetical protein KFK09_025695 [Dendrobium nobile]|uniref:Uncharacterized protein n=1 Tax=Dendrobium nobile TaxID=94219 RepID=A0A8T3AAQ7_DENNO|nr:hypothetical protein KFK09_025695 [Dendrobium nobile]